MPAYAHGLHQPPTHVRVTVGLAQQPLILPLSEHARMHFLGVARNHTKL